MLKINNLTVTLQEKKVLENVNLDLESGSLHVIMGPNGSGKSTLAYTLMGHPRYTVQSGSVYLDTTNILELPVEQRARAGLFLACQYPQEVPGVQVFTFLKEAHRMLTGLDISVALFKEQLYACMDMVKLDHSFAYRNLHEGFSGGEKKRLEIVQLLLFKPKVAILDEIDSGLDIDGLKVLAQALEQAQKQNPSMTILLITHYQRMLDYIYAHKVHILVHGTITASGDATIISQVEQKGYDGLSL